MTLSYLRRVLAAWFAHKQRPRIRADLVPINSAIAAARGRHDQVRELQRRRQQMTTDRLRAELSK